MEQYIIKSEDEAFEFLKTITSEDFDSRSVELRFEEWPTLHIHLKGQLFDSSLTTDVMQGMLDLQKHLRQSYATLAYNGDVRKLTATDKERLTLVVKVSPGTSGLDINLQDIAEQFVNGALANMTPGQTYGAVMTAILMVGGVTMFKHWVASKAQEKELDTRVRLSEQETARMQIIQDVAARDDKVQVILEESKQVHAALLKSISAADVAEVGDVEMSGSDMKELSKSTRATSHDVRIDEVFRVDMFDATSPNQYKVHVRNDALNMKFNATISQNMTADDQEMLFMHIKARTPVRLHINARDVRGEVRNAVIVMVSDPAED